MSYILVCLKSLHFHFFNICNISNTLFILIFSMSMYANSLGMKNLQRMSLRVFEEIICTPDRYSTLPLKLIAFGNKKVQISVSQYPKACRKLHFKKKWLECWKLPHGQHTRSMTHHLQFPNVDVLVVVCCDDHLIKNNLEGCYLRNSFWMVTLLLKNTDFTSIECCNSLQVHFRNIYSSNNIWQREVPSSPNHQFFK